MRIGKLQLKLTRGTIAVTVRPLSAQVYHFVCHVLALLCVAVGLSSAIVYHTRIYVQHMRSLHSWMGIGTMGLYCLQFVFGFFAYCWPKLGFGPRKASLPTHQVREGKKERRGGRNG